MKYLDKLCNICKQYNISKEDVCIVGSSVLAEIVGRDSNDIDAILKNAVRERLIVSNGKELNILKSGTIDFQDVQFSRNRYKAIGLDDENIFNSKYMDSYEGFRIIKVEIEVAKKIVRDAPKDRLDVIRFCNSEYNYRADWALIYELVSYKAPVSNSIMQRICRSFAHRIIRLGGGKI